LNPSSLGLQVNVNDQIMGGAQLEFGCPGTAHGHCNRDKASTAVALEVPVGLPGGAQNEDGEGDVWLWGAR
jgi:hypothetical protein